nr:dienelactone hydrolase family protein [Nitrosomonas nitrosa]
MNRRIFCQTAAASLGGVMARGAYSQTPNPPISPEVALFEGKTFRGASGETMPYRLFVPKGYAAKKKYPLVIWLHGAAGRGSDNLKQITGGNLPGATVWVKAENQARHPCLVIAPQCPENKLWVNFNNMPANVPSSPEQIENAASSIAPAAMENLASSAKPSEHLRLAAELIEAMQKSWSIDARRIYLAGQSMGGFATWALIGEQADKFAAAVPLCSGGNVAHAPRLTRLPIWAFHGDKDPLVPVTLSRRMIEEIKKAGGKPKYTELAGAGHNIGEQVFATPELLPWVFAQRGR